MTTQETGLQAGLDARPMRDRAPQRAVESHEIVGKAVGVLMELHRMTDDAAFAAMARVGMDHNVRLRDVAVAMLTIVATDGEVPDLTAAAAALELLPPQA